jgi:predicted AAA+ superfamily ATPase
MELLERLLRQNSWWQTGKIESVQGLKQRELFKKILEYEKSKQIISIVGLRRMGKTTLLLQVADYLLEKTDAKKIMYFSFDELLGKGPEIIEQVLKVYEEEILKSELRDVYIFFDEINLVPDWQIVIKRYYDLGLGIKFFVSGSSSVFLRKSKESLAGRIFEFELNPLSFPEYLNLKGVQVKNVSLQSPSLRTELNKYFFCSFPELINEDSYEKIRNYVKSVVEKIVFYDIPKVYDVGQPEMLREILSIMVRNPGMQVDYESIASSLGITYPTVSKYILYLKKAYLVRLLYNFRGSPIASARKLKKCYPITPILASAFMESEKDYVSILPKLIEGLVVVHLDAKFFWRKYYEVDILHNKVPIEVKYRSQIEFKGALEVAKELKSKELIIITKDDERKMVRDHITITCIPLWKFLLEGFPK